VSYATGYGPFGYCPALYERPESSDSVEPNKVSNRARPRAALKPGLWTCSQCSWSCPVWYVAEKRITECLGCNAEAIPRELWDAVRPDSKVRGQRVGKPERQCAWAEHECPLPVRSVNARYCKLHARLTKNRQNRLARGKVYALQPQ
jgi:hypothetical protein